MSAIILYWQDDKHSVHSALLLTGLPNNEDNNNFNPNYISFYGTDLFADKRFSSSSFEDDLKRYSRVSSITIPTIEDGNPVGLSEKVIAECWARNYATKKISLKKLTEQWEKIDNEYYKLREKATTGLRITLQNYDDQIIAINTQIAACKDANICFKLQENKRTLTKTKNCTTAKILASIQNELTAIDLQHDKKIELLSESVNTIREFPDYFKLGNNCARMVYTLIQKGDTDKKFAADVGGIMDCDDLMEYGGKTRDKIVEAIKSSNVQVLINPLSNFQAKQHNYQPPKSEHLST